MKKIGLFYGTTLGTTGNVAKEIEKILGVENVDIYNVADGIKEIENYENIILGTNTWGYGELQDDWVSVIDELETIDLTGKKIAIYGTGDQEGYSDTFVDAIGIIYEKIKDKNLEIVGFISKENYNFSDSKALIGEKLAGLAIDDMNQSNLTEERIKKWTKQLKEEFGI